MPSLTRAAALLPALLSSVAHAVNPVEVRGRDFVDTVTNNRLMIIGVDYQPGGQGAYKPSSGEDALTDGDVCLRDAVLMQKLGVNTLRVYNLDPTLDHSQCASIFNAAGIYMILDVNSPLPGESINRAEPWTSYNSDYLNRAFGIIENFKNFPNTLGFFSANEVMNDLSTAEFNPQYIRAVQRDMKNYIKNHADRTIPVGYSAADVSENRQEMAAYMNCGPDGARSDFFAFNDYSWCDPDTFEKTDWSQKAKNFSSYSIPLFLSEYGCKENKRTFNAVSALYDTSKMTSVYSGGLAYEYTEESDNKGFGLVKVKSDTEVEDKDDFTALKSALQKAPAPTGDGGYKTDGKPSTCPKKSDHWDVDLKDDELPVMPDGVDEYFKNGAGDAPGLKGGSQEAGSDKVETGPAASGAVTSGASDSSGTGSSSGSEPSKGAAAGLAPEFSFAPMACGLVVLVSSLLGGSLIL